MIAATKLRDASGVMMSNVSAAPGARWRRARIEMRAWSSAARVCATSFAFANTCRLAAGPNARSNAAIGIQTYRSSDTPPAVPCCAWMPTIRKPRPAMRTAWPSGSAAGNSASTMARPSTMTCAPLTSSSFVMGRPRSIPTSRMSNSAACVPLIVAFSNLRPPVMTSPARCAVAA